MLPLFPLTLVLLPRTPLPLHIFEDRYKEMIGEALESDTEFGIVLVMKRGLAGIGCAFWAAWSTGVGAVCASTLVSDWGV